MAHVHTHTHDWVYCEECNVVYCDEPGCPAEITIQLVANACEMSPLRTTKANAAVDLCKRLSDGLLRILAVANGK